MRIVQSYDRRPLNLLAVGGGGLVAAASDKFGVVGDVEVWDAATGARRFVQVAPGHSAVSSVALLSDGRHLFAAGHDLEITVVDTATTKVVARVPTAFERPAFALSADGTRLLASSGRNAPGAIGCFALDAGLNVTSLWSARPPGPFWIDALAVGRDGARAAAAERFESATGRPQSALAVRDGATGKRLVAIPLDAADPVGQVAFTADGAKLLVRTESRIVRTFDAATGAPAGELPHAGRQYVGAIAAHPRGPVACARNDGTVTFWNVETREQLRTLDWNTTGKLVSLAFSPDGALAAAGTEDGKVVVWDVDL